MAEKIIVANPKLSPILGYPVESLPENIRKIVDDGRLMPYVHKSPGAKGKWVAGYSYHQVAMICAIPNAQYMRQLVSKGELLVVGSAPIKPESDVVHTLLDIYKTHEYALKHRRYALQEGMRTYELRADAGDWLILHPFLTEHKIEWKDVTDIRKMYQERSRAKKLMKKNPR